jgi:hypothetical protein
MSHFIIVSAKDGEFLLNLDVVSRIIPSYNQMLGNHCNVFLLGREDETPISIQIEYGKLKQQMGL